MPPGVVTVTATVPAACAGANAVISVGESIVKLVAAWPPKLTALAPARSLPLTVTLVPPLVGPAAGVRAVTTGRAYSVNRRIRLHALRPAELRPRTFQVRVTLRGSAERGVQRVFLTVAPRTNRLPWYTRTS